MNGRVMAGLLVAMVGMVGVAGSVVTQPTLYVTSLGQDLSADGRTVVGPVYDAATNTSPVKRMTRGGAAQMVGTRSVEDGLVYCNADGSIVVAGMADVGNVAGYGTDATLAHVWSGNGPWQILGLAPDGGSCGSSVNSAWGLAKDSGEVAVSGWAFGDCGMFRAWVWSPVTGEYTALPASNSGAPLYIDADGTRSNAISADGSVVCGWDSNIDLGSEWPYQRACAWRRVNGVWTQTILDHAGGSADVVSGDGRVVVGKMSPETMLATFGTEETTPVAWIWDGSAWVPHNLGGTPGMMATGASRDGSTIVGHKFIWREDLNGGVAMGLDEYLASRGVNFGGLSIDTFRGSAVGRMSEDGRSVIVKTIDDRNPCLAVFGTAVLDLEGGPCVAPTVMLEPVSQAVGNPPEDYFGVILNVFAAGTWELRYQWQKEIEPGVWTDLEDDGCDEFLPANFDYKGVSGSQLRIGYLSGQWLGAYRCVITNDCGVVTSAVASITAAPPVCAADFNGDGFLDFFDYGDYVDCFETGNCPEGKTADFNGDEFVDFFDYEAFVTVFETGC